MGLDLTQAARGMIRVINANTIRAFRVISVEKGADQRRYTLVAFGGAGPLHAAQLARELGIPRVLVPESPGLLCAIGLLVADVRADFSRTHVMETRGADLKAANEILRDLQDQAAAWLRREKISPLESRFEFAVDMRSVMPKPIFPRSASAGPDASAAIRGERPVFFEQAGGFVPCRVYDRAGLRAGHRLLGPAVVEQMDATTLVLPGQAASVDRYRNIHLLVDGSGPP
jgi:N-methylhydantoinase A